MSSGPEEELRTELMMLRARWVDEARSCDPRSGVHAGIWHCINDLWDVLNPGE